MNQLCGTTTTIPAVIKRVGKSLGFAFNITSRYSSINKYRNIGGLSISIIFTIVVFMLVKSEETLATVTGSADFGFNPLLRRPQGPQGCLEKRNCPLSSNLVVWCAKIGPKS